MKTRNVRMQQHTRYLKYLDAMGISDILYPRSSWRSYQGDRDRRYKKRMARLRKHRNALLVEWTDEKLDNLFKIIKEY